MGVLENFSYLCSSMSRRAQAVVLTNNFFHCGFMISLWALLKGVSVSHMAGRGFHIDVLVDAIIEKKPAMVKKKKKKRKHSSEFYYTIEIN